MPGGTCVAGKEILVGSKIGDWVRPVGAIEGEGLSPQILEYSGDGDLRLLDIIEVPVLGMTPIGHQQENWLIDEGRRWTRVGKLSSYLLRNFEDPVDGLWIDGESTICGLNDKFAVEMASAIKNSLRLVRVDKLDLKVWQPHIEFGDDRWRVYGRIWVSDTEYRLSVTDHEIEREYLAKPEGYYRIHNCYLTISLGKPFEGSIYKLIAAVMRD